MTHEMKSLYIGSRYALWAGPSSESPIESSEVFKGFWHYSLPTGYSMEPREASNPPTTHLLKNKNLIQPR